MGTSTFCKWAVEHDNPVSHARCRTDDCECGCHGPTTPAVTAGSGYAAEQLRYLNASPERPARRTYTDADKARIIADWHAAPRGTKSEVLARHGVQRSMVERWAKQWYLTPDVPERPSDPEPEPEPSVLDEVDDTDQLTVELDPGDRDVLDALAFLTDLAGGAAALVADLVNDVVAAGGAAQDVQQLLAARRARHQERTVG